MMHITKYFWYKKKRIFKRYLLLINVHKICDSNSSKREGVIQKIR